MNIHKKTVAYTNTYAYKKTNRNRNYMNYLVSTDMGQENLVIEHILFVNVGRKHC